MSQFELLVTAPGAVTQLRELILTLAVQGKLAPQDVRDETASALLERIARERIRLISAGKLRQSKDSTADDASEPPYLLPNGWAWSTLAAIGVINPRNDAADNVVASFVQMSSIPIAFNEPHATEARPWHAIKSGFTQFAEGDVGVAKITPCFENGKSTVFQDLSNGIGAGTTELHIVRPLCGVVPRYVLLFLKSPRFLRDGEATMTGTAGQKRLPRSFFENCPFPLPPLQEQARIVARVDELMRLCDALEAKGRLEVEHHQQLLTTLLGTLTASRTPEELADNWQRVADHFDLLLDRPEAVDALEKAIQRLAVRGMLVQQDPADLLAEAHPNEIQTHASQRPAAGRGVRKAAPPLSAVDATELPFVLPSGWTVCRFGDVADVSGGVTLGRKSAIPKPLTLPYLRVANVQRWRLELDSMKEVVIDESELPRYQLESGDLLITEGGDWDKVGRTAIWRSELPQCLHQNHVFKARVRSTAWTPAWGELYLNSDVARAYFSASAKQTTNLASINMTELKHCVFPIPPLAEQVRIVARVAQIRQMCMSMRERLAAGQIVQARLAEALVDQTVNA